MIAFYTWSRPAIYLVTFLIDLCVVSASLALVCSFYRFPRSRKWFFETLLELFVLIYILYCSVLHGEALEGYNQNIYVPAGIFSSKVSAWIFLGVLFFLLPRSIYVAFLRYREIKTGLSAFSVKNAINTMPTGILFYERDGYHLLSNTKMEELLGIIFGVRDRQNVNSIFERLVSGDINPECEKTVFEGQIVCFLPDKTAWMFTKTELPIKNKMYSQITAVDITERWRLTAELKEKNDEMRQKNERLKETLANLHILSRERETKRAKMRAHDVLGQSLSMMLRSIRSSQTLDYEQFLSLSKGLIDDLKSTRAAPNPLDEFDSLRQTFASIGVDIALTGKLPSDGIKANLVLDILRESVTNAVRHGYASCISMQIDLYDDVYHIIITDNGRASSDTTTEGGGLTGMRKKLEEHNGTLMVNSRLEFVLSINLPEGSSNV